MKPNIETVAKEVYKRLALQAYTDPQKARRGRYLDTEVLALQFDKAELRADPYLKGVIPGQELAPRHISKALKLLEDLSLSRKHGKWEVYVPFYPGVQEVARDLNRHLAGRSHFAPDFKQMLTNHTTPIGPVENTFVFGYMQQAARYNTALMVHRIWKGDEALIDTWIGDKLLAMKKGGFVNGANAILHFNGKTATITERGRAVISDWIEIGSAFGSQYDVQAKHVAEQRKEKKKVKNAESTSSQNAAVPSK